MLPPGWRWAHLPRPRLPVPACVGGVGSSGPLRAPEPQRCRKAIPPGKARGRNWSFLKVLCWALRVDAPSHSKQRPLAAVPLRRYLHSDAPGRPRSVQAHPVPATGCCLGTCLSPVGEAQAWRVAGSPGPCSWSGSWASVGYPAGAPPVGTLLRGPYPPSRKLEALRLVVTHWFSCPVSSCSSGSEPYIQAPPGCVLTQAPYPPSFRIQTPAHSRFRAHAGVGGGGALSTHPGEEHTHFL